MASRLAKMKLIYVSYKFVVQLVKYVLKLFTKESFILSKLTKNSKLHAVKTHDDT